MERDPYRRIGDHLAELLQECPTTVLLGFKNEPPPSFYRELDRLGGVELLTVQTSGTTFFKSGSRWGRFLFRLGLAYDRVARRRDQDWQVTPPARPGVTPPETQRLREIDRAISPGRTATLRTTRRHRPLTSRTRWATLPRSA